MTHPIRITATALALVLTGVAIAACAPSTNSEDAAATASACGEFPLSLEHAFGSAQLAEKPERVVVITDVDLDIALALGVEPVLYPGYELGAWQAEAVEGLDLASYDPFDGIDFEAIAAAEPDVILATSGWSLDEDYAALNAIAPVIAYTSEGGLDQMTWDQRTELAGCGLGLVDEADAVVDDVNAAFADAARTNPQFDDKTITYAVIHPDQITYSSYEGSDVWFFESLGFTLPATASEFTGDNAGLSKENIDKLESDVLVIGYPFGEEGMLSRDELESDPLFQGLDVVQRGGYVVLGDDVASPIAYPSPLGLPWALEQALPALEAATN